MNFELPSLQELSFKVITQEFSKYALAYSKTNDDYFKKNLRFLQRVYSQSLFTELDKIGQLKEEHFDILLNEHLKILDIGTLLSLTDKDVVIEKVKPIGHSITELSCTKDYPVSDSVDVLKALLPHVPNVTKLFLPYFCNDEILKLIASFCSQLHTLNIQDSADVTGEGLKALCLDSNNQVSIKCPLKNLCLTNSLIPCDDIAILIKHIPSLQTIDYEQLPSALYSIHGEDMENNVLENTVKYSLINLNFNFYCEKPEFPALLKLCVELCPNVKKLSVPISSNEELQLCCRFPQLQCISLFNFKIRPVVDLNILFLSRGSKLKELTADFCTLSVSSLIENCPNVESVGLKNSEYQKINGKITKSLNHLKNLELDLVNFSDDNCTQSIGALLTASPNLKHLSLLHCNFNDSEMIAKISTFSLNCKLESLTFKYSDVGVDLLQQIVLNCNSLKSLFLENCENISHDDIDNIRHTISSSNRAIDVSFYSDQSDYSYSDDGLDFDADYDVFDEYDCYYDDYDDDDEDDDNDFDCGYNDLHFW